MIDYSQYVEQARILKALGFLGKEWPEFKPGRFLDIGAWDAKSFSNTRALFELGWEGVMVEPSPGPMRKLLEEYGKHDRITLIQALVGLNSGLQTLRVTDDALSTTNAEQAKQWTDHGYPYLGNLIVPQISIRDLLRMHEPFDFINIDTEGSSVDLLIGGVLAYEFRFGLPRCICVEHDGEQDSIRLCAADRGYRTEDLGINMLLWRDPADGADPAQSASPEAKL